MGSTLAMAKVLGALRKLAFRPGAPLLALQSNLTGLGPLGRLVRRAEQVPQVERGRLGRLGLVGTVDMQGAGCCLDESLGTRCTRLDCCSDLNFIPIISLSFLKNCSSKINPHS